MGSAREVILAWVDACNRRDAEADLQVAIGQPLVGRPAILKDLRTWFGQLGLPIS